MMEQMNLGGRDWLMKEFVGMDWVWRDSVKQDSQDTRWWNKARVPGSVLHDLWENKLVPDPYYECNSKLVEWVPARTWVYKKIFLLPGEWEGKNITLHMKGIDYEGEIFLNGHSLGKQKGMYLPWKRDVTDVLCRDGENLLAVVLEPAPPEQPQVGKTSLVSTHKSRMTYWWDFCPRMIHQGIWDEVYLEMTKEAVLEDVNAAVLWSSRHPLAKVNVQVEALAEDGCMVRASLEGECRETSVKDGRAQLEFQISNPRLWWPNGWGEAFQYELIVSLYEKDGGISDVRKCKVGIREIVFGANEDAPSDAPELVLWVNGKRIYIKGYNWVPMDVMYGVERPEKLKHLIRLAKEAGINMFRVWGGGLIEKDLFYELCAEHGILIWQEFILSSSGIDNKTPENKEYLHMLQKEAEVIIKNKRRHTALAVWCGGNELQDDSGNPLDSSDTVLAMLKEQVEALDSGRKWLPTSPSGGVFLNSMENLERCPDRLFDVHGPWEHQGLLKHCSLYNKGSSLLHTEFGVEGMTNRSTLLYSVGKEHLMPANKENEIYFHRGAWWVNEPLVQETFGGNLEELEQIRKGSQYLQYEGLKYAVESNRRRAYHNSGSFPWQFNEPYPNLYCTSHVDYYGNPKPVYYGMKKAYGGRYISASFASPSLAGQQDFYCKLYAGTGEGAFAVTADIFDMGGRSCFHKEWNGEAVLGGAGSAMEITMEKQKLPEDLFLLRLKLADGEQVLAENEYLFTGSKDLSEVYRMGEPKIAVEKTAVSGWRNGLLLKNTGSIAALFLYLTGIPRLPKESYFYFSDNYLVLLPGEERPIGFETAGEEGVSVAMEALNVGYSEIKEKRGKDYANNSRN